MTSKSAEWSGLDKIQQTVHGMGCIFREISKDDYGIDGEIEIVTEQPDGGFATTGGIMKVQAHPREHALGADAGVELGGVSRVEELRGGVEGRERLESTAAEGVPSDLLSGPGGDDIRCGTSGAGSRHRDFLPSMRNGTRVRGIAWRDKSRRLANGCEARIGGSRSSPDWRTRDEW